MELQLSVIALWSWSPEIIMEGAMLNTLWNILVPREREIIIDVSEDALESKREYA